MFESCRVGEVESCSCSCSCFGQKPPCRVDSKLPTNGHFYSRRDSMDDNCKVYYEAYGIK